MTSVYDFAVKSLAGKELSLGDFRGQVLLIVNTASQCGFTPQYAGLEQLFKTLHPLGLTVLGFPCNQFGAQEPGSAAEIQTFCSTTYGVSFPLSAKLEVNGPGRDPLYAWLTDPANGHAGDIECNFEKFLIGRDGRVLMRYPPTVKPEDKGLLQDIANAL